LNQFSCKPEFFKIRIGDTGIDGNDKPLSGDILSQNSLCEHSVPGAATSPLYNKQFYPAR
jgi:hypothetical protein